MYPRWKYKKGELGVISVIMLDSEQEQRLGGEWFDTPAELEASQLRVEKVLDFIAKKERKKRS